MPPVLVGDHSRVHRDYVASSLTQTICTSAICQLDLRSVTAKGATPNCAQRPLRLQHRGHLNAEGVWAHGASVMTANTPSAVS